MKHLQPKTLQIILAILSKRRFSQRGLWRLCNRSNTISLGQVNKVVTDLQRNGFVERLRKIQSYESLEEKGPAKDDGLKFDMKRADYMLVDPIGLLRYISMFRAMDDLRFFTLSLDATENEVIAELSKRGAIFCLGTAQEHYTPYYRPDEVSCYSQDPEKIYNYLKTAKTGSTKVSCYRIDYVRSTKNMQSILNSLFALKSGRIRLTTKVQTVIDMFCSEKGVYTKPLLKKLWGVEI